MHFDEAEVEISKVFQWPAVISARNFLTFLFRALIYYISHVTALTDTTVAPDF